MQVSLAVFTRDLRVRDNPVLSAAASAGPVVPAFIVDDDIIRRFSSHASRLAFLLDSLVDLRRSLSDLGGALIVRRGVWIDEVMRLTTESGADVIHVADDYSAYARRRLAGLERAAASERIEVRHHRGATIAEPGRLRPAGGSAYQVFGPYYRRWQSVPVPGEVPAPQRLAVPGRVRHGRVPRLSELTDASPAGHRPPGGERAALDRLRDWAAGGLADYAANRDMLAVGGTSRLSPYLHLGCVSARTVAAHAYGRPGAVDFGRQLAWRDFFHQLLAARPEAAWTDIRSRGDQWREDRVSLRAWREGRTGYPVVDAAMRQLASEAFMDNRARMIVASFLTKDLYLDWRIGAAHFMAALADGDVAANQLNWQWVAGTGTDTSPHRVFSPARQSRRFDPSGEYLRRYLPELAGLPLRQIHDPDPDSRRDCGYPAPIVDHQAAVAEYRARVSRRSGR